MFRKATAKVAHTRQLALRRLRTSPSRNWVGCQTLLPNLQTKHKGCIRQRIDCTYVTLLITSTHLHACATSIRHKQQTRSPSILLLAEGRHTQRDIGCAVPNPGI